VLTLLAQSLPPDRVAVKL